jgi:hypothetical protein
LLAHEQRIDLLEQTIVGLAWLMGDAYKNCKEKKNLLRDLPCGMPDPILIVEFDKILFCDGKFLIKRFII